MAAYAFSRFSFRLKNALNVFIISTQTVPPITLLIPYFGMVVAFGIFIFKAGYAQSELLFYFLMFVTFLGCWHLLRSPLGWRAIAIAAGTGVTAGFAQLTKAAMLPMTWA